LPKQHNNSPNSSDSTNEQSELTCNVITFTQCKQSVELFSYLSQQSWAMWLDSCNSQHVDSRFDIMVWDPEVTLSTTNNKTTVKTTHNNTIILSSEDPLVLVSQAIKKVFSTIHLSSSLTFSFKGGAVGYLSYDLGRQFEVHPDLCEQDINIPDMAMGIYNKAVIFDNKTKSFYLMCIENDRNNIENSLFKLLKQTTDENVTKVKTAVKTNLSMQANIQTDSLPDSLPEKQFSLHSDWLSNMSFADYAKKFNQVNEYLLAGDCYQINLAQRFSATYSGNEFDAYKILRKENNAPFSAFIRIENTAILSVSPERFLQLNNRQVQSKPIKGTRPRNELPQLDTKAKQDLKSSAKDNAENLMIVDLLRNDISKVCEAGSVVVPKLFEIESFPAVHHLVSTIEGKLSPQFDATDLLRAAFPGGSITGAPKIRAMEIIEELEPHRRSLYCGSIAYISACGNLDSSITIRTLICENNKVHCWAGGGLVADSVLEEEYQETFDKINKITPILKKHFLIDN